MASRALVSSLARTSLSRASIPSASRVCAASRTFSSFPQLRPTILPQSGTVFRSSRDALSRTQTAPDALLAANPEALDLVPKTSISSHPAFAGLQVRFGPRQTMNPSSRLIRKRRHGFLSRIRTRTGRRTLLRRKTKGRTMLSS